MVVYICEKICFEDHNDQTVLLSEAQDIVFQEQRGKQFGYVFV